MQNHRIFHRFVSKAEPGSARIGARKAFDVGAVRKMLREGATVAAAAEASGLSVSTLRTRLKTLGLWFIVADRERKRATNSAAATRREAQRREDRKPGPA